MRATNQIEFEKFLQTIVYESYHDEAKDKEFKAIGIDADEWPPCHAKDLMQEFNFLLKKRDRFFAKFSISEKIKHLGHHDLPKDTDILIAFYKKNIKEYKTGVLAEYILKDPQNAEKYIVDYIKNQKSNIELKDLKNGIIPAIQDLQKRIEAKQALVVLPDFPLLSESIGGFNPKRITIITASSGFGKTKLAINLALSARKLMNVLYYNMEMGDEDFVSMFIQNKTDTDNKSWYDGRIKPEKIEAMMSELETGNSIYYTNGQSLNIDEIAASIYSKSNENEMMFVVIDYDQKLISNLKMDEWLAMVRNIEKLEDVAKRSNAQIVILAQADKDGEIKSSKRGNQPASAVLNFYSEGDLTLKKYLIKPIKNRFGSNNFCIEYDYYPAMSKIKELKYHEQESINLKY